MLIYLFHCIIYDYGVNLCQPKTLKIHVRDGPKLSFTTPTHACRCRGNGG
jgi:hypothetical protein